MIKMYYSFYNDSASFIKNGLTVYMYNWNKMKYKAIIIQSIVVTLPVALSSIELQRVSLDNTTSFTVVKSTYYWLVAETGCCLNKFTVRLYLWPSPSSPKKSLNTHNELNKNRPRNPKANKIISRNFWRNFRVSAWLTMIVRTFWYKIKR